MKCKVKDCQRESVVAFDPDAPDRGGYCWPHACAWADAVSEIKPVTLLHASNIMPPETEEDIDAVIKANETMMAAVNRAIGRLM